MQSIKKLQTMWTVLESRLKMSIYSKCQTNSVFRRSTTAAGTPLTAVSNANKVTGRPIASSVGERRETMQVAKERQELMLLNKLHNSNNKIFQLSQTSIHSFIELFTCTLPHFFLLSCLTHTKLTQFETRHCPSPQIFPSKMPISFSSCFSDDRFKCKLVEFFLNYGLYFLLLNELPVFMSTVLSKRMFRYFLNSSLTIFSRIQ